MGLFDKIIGRKLNPDEIRRVEHREIELRDEPETHAQAKVYKIRLDELKTMLHGTRKTEDYQIMIPIFDGIYEGAMKRLKEDDKKNQTQVRTNL